MQKNAKKESTLTDQCSKSSYHSVVQWRDNKTMNVTYNFLERKWEKRSYNEGEVMLHIHVSNSASRGAKKQRTTSRALYEITLFRGITSHFLFTLVTPWTHMYVFLIHTHKEDARLMKRLFCLPFTLASLGQQCIEDLSPKTSRPHESPPTFKNIMQVITA